MPAARGLLALSICCRAAILIAALGIPGIALALDLSQQVAFKIAPQKLSSALIEFSHQAKVQIAVGQDLGERGSAGLNGRFAIGDALARLLAPSGLHYRVVNDTSISISEPEPINLNETKPGPRKTQESQFVGTVLASIPMATPDRAILRRAS